MKFLDLLFITKLHIKFDKINEPWRLLMAMAVILIPVYCLNGVIHHHSKFILLLAASFLLYLIISRIYYFHYHDK